jgi:DNA-binding Lrp family transcriptional regulator
VRPALYAAGIHLVLSTDGVSSFAATQRRIGRWSEAMAMVRAYVLIQTHVGQAGAVTERLALVEGVSTAEHVSGPYDVISLIESGDMDTLGHVTLRGIQAVEGVTRTVTCPVLNL